MLTQLLGHIMPKPAKEGSSGLNDNTTWYKLHVKFCLDNLIPSVESTRARDDIIGIDNSI